MKTILILTLFTGVIFLHRPSFAEEAPATAPAAAVKPPAAKAAPDAAVDKTAAAVKPRKSSFLVWFEHLKKGLSDSSVQDRYQKRRLTAVAAVRGSPQDSVDPDKPQWKGKRKSKKDLQLKAERAEFAAAVDLIIEGKQADGLSALETFEKAHPESALLPDVREARQKAVEMKTVESAEKTEP